MPEKKEVVEVTMDKMEQIRKAVGDFRNAVAGHMKDLHADKGLAFWSGES